MKILFIHLFCLVSFSLFAQRDVLMKEISLTTCECIKQADENIGFEMMVGLCLLQGASPLADEIKEELGLDLTDVNNYEKLGEMLAPSLIENCPEFMALMMGAAADGTLDLIDDDKEEEEALPVPDEIDNGETWSDIDSGTKEATPEYGGPENKKFITFPLENTNGSGLIKPTVKGKIKSVSKGLSNEVVLEGTDKKTYTLYLAMALENADKLKKGKTVKVTYQEKTLFHAGRGERTVVKLITKID